MTEFLYSFDDVLLVPQESAVLPVSACVKTSVTDNIQLSVPIMSSAMDTVTESRLAIAIAQHGGMGCIHKNMSVDDQISEVRKVKKHESWIVDEPITVHPDDSLEKVFSIMEKYKYSGIPVIEKESRRLVGILTNRDVRFIEDKRCKVYDVMTRDNLVTVKEGIAENDAIKLLHRHKIERLLVVDDNYCCIGLITVKDIEKFNNFPNSCKDDKGRLRVAAAVGSGKVNGIERAEALNSSEVDLIVVDTAHGHSNGVIDTIKQIRALFPDMEIVGGNVATAEGALALINAGVNAVKVGIGPGSICTTRIVTGVGIPQFSAILNVSRACRDRGVKVIADGGIKYSGDISKAIAAGADVVMIGSIFAGTEESPGEVILYKGRAYKAYRGMGSLGAMKSGSADRYFQDASGKLIPEGVEGRVPLKGMVSSVINQLVGGLKASMGYTGNPTIGDMKKNCKFVVITSSGFRESHAHDVIVTQESPNY